MSVLVLMLLAALVHCSCAIKCYVCKSKTEPACDDHFKNSSSIHTLTCQSNACMKLKGTAKEIDNDVEFTGVARGCGTATIIGCTDVTNQDVPALHLKDATGEICYCASDLCNSATRTSAGRVAASLLALVTARVLRQ